MIVSLLLLFLATAWIIYVYLDRYHYFVLPGARATPPVANEQTGSPKTKSAAPIKQRGILGASRPQATPGKTLSPTVVGVEPGATADANAHAKSSFVDEPDKDQDDENGYGDQDSENPEDNPVDTDDTYSDPDYSGQTDDDGDGDDEDSVYGGGDPDEEDKGVIESSASSSADFDDDESGSDRDIHPVVTNDSGNLELTNRHSPLHEFGRPTALKPSIVNQVKAIELATTEDSSEQETLSRVAGFTDAFTDYDLDTVLDSEENQATQRVVPTSPHYLYRDLPLSEYAAHFRAIREAAQLIKREIDRAASKESVQHLARGYVRYIGEKGLSEDTNITASTASVLLGSDRSANVSGTGNNKVDTTSEYIDIFSRIEQAVATSQQFDAS